MRLEHWLDLTKTPIEAFAKRVGANGSSIGRAIRGEQNIRMSLVNSIVRETGGAVTAEDLRASYDTGPLGKRDAAANGVAA